MDPMNAVQELAGCFPFLSTSKQKTKQTQTTETAQGAAPNNNKKNTTAALAHRAAPNKMNRLRREPVLGKRALYEMKKMLVEFKFNSLDSLPHKDFFPFNFQY